YEYAMDRKVVPVSPNTFFAFLQVIILGVRNIEIVRGAKKLQGMLTKIERDYGYFFKNFQDIGSTLNRAVNAYEVGERHISRFKKNLDGAIRFEVPDTVSGEEGQMADDADGHRR
ncbi:MAG: DNA recombination protein RmuC, partial [Candidatus Omnitrophica bacterium]|nr:DNA recombination protein RmuC [Candidatus Omnitrophota bacterium]